MRGARQAAGLVPARQSGVRRVVQRANVSRSRQRVHRVHRDLLACPQHACQQRVSCLVGAVCDAPCGPLVSSSSRSIESTSARVAASSSGSSMSWMSTRPRADPVAARTVRGSLISAARTRGVMTGLMMRSSWIGAIRMRRLAFDARARRPAAAATRTSSGASGVRAKPRWVANPAGVRGRVRQSSGRRGWGGHACRVGARAGLARRLGWG